ncbi:MAG: double-strand break repair helicase AddA [Alphaproteobacteria bacterium]
MSRTTDPLDPAREQRRAADPGASAWVGASAGTGKTKVLTDRVFNHLLTGVPPQRILCLTFTKAAAAEMGNRLAARLGRWATDDDQTLHADLADLHGTPPDAETCARARRLFAQVLDVPGGMKIMTIHAFCQSLLKRFPLEAGVAPHFEILEERDAALAMTAARDAVLGRAREGGDASLTEALAVLTGQVQETRFPVLMAEMNQVRGRLARTLTRHGGVGPLIAAVCHRLEVLPSDTRNSVLAAACDEARFDARSLRMAAEALLTGSDADKKRGQGLAAWLADPASRVAGFDAHCLRFLTREEEVRKTLITKKLAIAFPAAAAALAVEAERLQFVNRRLKAVDLANATSALIRLGAALGEAYADHKAVHGRLDYDDLIQAARHLLETEGQAAWVLYKLDGGIDHLLIDEAQDTSPDQWAVVRALTEEFFAGEGRRWEAVRTVFAVGDRKQSIYSFQGADPAGFEATRLALKQRVESIGRSWQDVNLHVSFRSTQAVLDAVDAVFTGPVAGDGVAMAGDEIRHIAARAGQGGLVEIWPPVTPRIGDTSLPWKPPVERTPGDSPSARLAGLVARRLRAMIGREMLTARGRPVRAGDILVLVRRRSGFVEDLVRALKQLAVPVAGADRMVLSQQLAVMDLAALGAALLLPGDDLTLATVLKGPLVGLSEDSLFALANPRGSLSLWTALRRHEGDGTEFAAAWDLLSGLARRVDFVSPHEFFAEVLGRLRGRRRLVARLGVEAEDAIDEFMTLTLAYETRHPPSLQGFLHWLAGGETTVKRDMDQGGGDAVRIMTVHGAKGLQAPIVFLPDTLQVPTQSDPLLWSEDAAGELVFWAPRRSLETPLCQTLREGVDQERDREYRRLLYVAMTRAEDRLYVCGWHGTRPPSDQAWYYLIRAAVEPLAIREADPFLASDPEAPEDRNVLRLASLQTAPPRVESPAEVPTPSSGAWKQAWIDRPPPAEPSPPRPLVPSRPDGEESAVRSPFGPDDGVRFRRGRWIHRLLQSLPEVAVAHREAAARRYLDQAAPELSPTQRAELTAETLAVLNHPEAAALFGPGSQAEVPVVGLVNDRVVSGQVDRLVVLPGKVIIADYKTNRPPPAEVSGVAPFTLRQMAAYRAAIRLIYPDRTVHCVLIWTDGPDVMTLPEEVLTQL